jgi:hypothetical protein
VAAAAGISRTLAACLMLSGRLDAHRMQQLLQEQWFSWSCTVRQNTITKPVVAAVVCSANMTMKSVANTAWELPISMPCDIMGESSALDEL